MGSFSETLIDPKFVRRLRLNLRESNVSSNGGLQLNMK